MKGSLLFKRAKAAVDILLMIGAVSLLVLSDLGSVSGNFWNTAHCIVGICWLILMTVHVWQHWNLTKAFTKKNVILRNKVTALMIACFIVMVASILLFTVNAGFKFHNVFGHIFAVVVVAHTITKWKRFMALWKSK